MAVTTALQPVKLTKAHHCNNKRSSLQGAVMQSGQADEILSTSRETHG
jgi:hypothetical protein